MNDAIARETERAGRALHEAGYFGPCGVDAFTYERGGAVVRRARSEINARYSMGFAVGFGGAGGPSRAGPSSCRKTSSAR